MSENGLIIKNTASPAFWLAEPSVAAFYEAIKKRGGEMRAVGGTVRDYLLENRKTYKGDIDFACDLHPDIIKQAAQDLSAEVRLHGERHGTVMVILQGKAYEVTALRRDIKTFGRQAQVEFGGDWRSDALRRDFTVNAMNMDAEGKIYDYCGGLHDLHATAGTTNAPPAPIIRFVGDADRRVREDYLRILRFFRFFSMLENSRLQQEALSVCAAHAEALADLSVERRRDEFLKLLAGAQARQALGLMAEHGILTSMGLPKELPVLADFMALDDIGDDFIVNFYLLSFAGEQAEDFCARWRLDNRRKRLFLAARKIMQLLSGGESMDYLLQSYRREAVALAVALVGGISDWRYIKEWRALDFPVDGHDIRALFSQEGAAVGVYLERGLRHWLAHDRGLSRDELLSWYKKLAKGADIA